MGVGEVGEAHDFGDVGVEVDGELGWGWPIESGCDLLSEWPVVVDGREPMFAAGAGSGEGGRVDGVKAGVATSSGERDIGSFGAGPVSDDSPAAVVGVALGGVGRDGISGSEPPNDPWP